MEKIETLTSLLEERSGLDIREAVARNIHYLNGYESFLYKNEIEYLLETLGSVLKSWLAIIHFWIIVCKKNQHWLSLIFEI